jgi:polar amino acid transport system permease protein
MFGLNRYDFLLIAKGFGTTLLLCSCVMLASLPLAFLLGLFRSRKIGNMVIRVIQGGATLLINAVRGTPLMLQLVFLFFGLPFMGINISPLTSAVVGLSVYSVAYLAEIVRSGVDSVAKDQWEAAASLGMKYFSTMTLVILPQAIRIMIPPTVGFFIGLIKDSSLCAVIGFVELSRAGRLLVEKTHLSLQIFMIVAILYFLICYPLSKMAKRMEASTKA